MRHNLTQAEARESFLSWRRQWEAAREVTRTRSQTHRELYAYSGSGTGDAVLSGGGKVSFSSREKGGKRHSFTAYIREDKYADLDGLLMCVHLSGVKLKFILILYVIKCEG